MQQAAVSHPQPPRRCFEDIPTWINTVLQHDFQILGTTTRYCLISFMAMQIFITGGTGYLGRRLIPMLLQKGYTVKALTRKGSEQKLPSGCIPLVCDPFDANAFAHHVEPGSTFIQLLGVSHPGPSKKEL